MKSVALISILLITTPALAKSEAKFTLPSDVKVAIVEEKFDKSGFKISGCTDKDTGCVINGRRPMGVVFGWPSTFVKSVSVSYHGQSYSLDASDMYDAWGSRPLKYKDGIRYFGGKCSDKKNCRFRGIFSDTAGTFVAEWKVVDGLPVRTVLTGSSDVVDLFMRHIDPP